MAAGDHRVAAAAARLRSELKEAGAAGQAAERDARRLAGLITVTLQAALLARHAPGSIAGAFAATRLEPVGHGPATPFGSLPAGLDLPEILTRAEVRPTA
jgi:putative acyl-CoA dehydrogenase